MPIVMLPPRATKKYVAIKIHTDRFKLITTKCTTELMKLNTTDGRIAHFRPARSLYDAKNIVLNRAGTVDTI